MSKVQQLLNILDAVKENQLTTTKPNIMEFDLPKDSSSIIKVIGVGGGGGNAVNHMYNEGIKGVDFVVCNTDQQALDISPVPLKIQLGKSLTEGRGAGMIPEIGKSAAIENIDDIKEILSTNTKMVFITAGMGGGTGTGAAPVIAKVAKEMDILTVGIVTVPFDFEGKKRRLQAENGLEEMRNNVDTLLIINNDRLKELFGNLTLSNAFSQADDILATAAKGIAEVISVTGMINVDFNDVNTVMKDSGVAVMGSAEAAGENRAIEAVKQSLASPLLNDNDIQGAKYVLLNITYGDQEILMDEIGDITDYIQGEAGANADVIWGHGFDPDLGDRISITVIATGFKTSPITGFEKAPEKKLVTLEEDQPKEIVSQIETPTQDSNTLKDESNNVNQDEDEPFMIVKGEEEEKTQKQTSIDWDLTGSVEKKEEVDEEEVVKHYLDDDLEAKVEKNESKPKSVLTPEEQAQKAKERLERIQSYTSKLKSSDGVADLESEPAYKRKKVELDEVPHSSEETMSKFTLTEDEENGEKKVELKQNNSFLHDNVD